MKKKDVYNKILDLCLQEGIEDSKNYLDILYLELKFYKKELINLEISKPFWFQKKKIEKIKEEKQIIQDKIEKCKQNISKELGLITKMFDN